MCDAVNIVNFCASFGDNEVLHNVNINIPRNSIYAFIGPSGCGKTTMLRSINRLNDLVPAFSCSGEIYVDGTNVYDIKEKKELEELRKGIGMIFQQPNPLPQSIFKNMALPVSEHYSISKKHLDELIIEKLKKSAIYDEVKDRLNRSALSLSGGQQQRLCIARALMLSPTVILFDEPCSALDPIATFAIEDLLSELKEEYTIIIVTHNMEQARRISDYTAFFYLGDIVEKGETVKIFSDPESEILNNYISGRGI